MTTVALPALKESSVGVPLGFARDAMLKAPAEPSAEAAIRKPPLTRSACHAHTSNVAYADDTRAVPLGCGAHFAHERCANVLSIADQNCALCEPTGPCVDLARRFADAERQCPGLFEEIVAESEQVTQLERARSLRELDADLNQMATESGLDASRIERVVENIVVGIRHYMASFCRSAGAHSAERPFLEGCYNNGELTMLLDQLEAAAVQDPCPSGAVTLGRSAAAVGAEHNALVRRALESLLMGSMSSRRLVPLLATFSGPRPLEDTVVYGGIHYLTRIRDYQQRVRVRELHLADGPLVLSDEVMRVCEQAVLQVRESMGRLFQKRWARVLMRFGLAKSMVAISVDSEGAYVHRGLRHSFVCKGNEVLGALTTPLPEAWEAQLHPYWRHLPGRREAEADGELLPYLLMERALRRWLDRLPRGRRVVAGSPAPRVETHALRCAAQQPYKVVRVKRPRDAKLCAQQSAPAAAFDVDCFFA